MNGAPDALLFEIQAWAEQRRTQTREAFWHDLVCQPWDTAQGAAPTVARTWLERAHRMLPDDGLVLFALATATLQDGDLAGAARRFERLATTHGIPQGWTGLALCAHLRQDTQGAVAALTHAAEYGPCCRAGRRHHAARGPAGLVRAIFLRTAGCWPKPPRLGSVRRSAHPP